MKKLMFGLALALSATCLADAIESNIVGYQTYKLVKGYNMFSPVFVDCTDNNIIKLEDIKLEGANGIGNDMLQTLNVNGGTSTQYFWLNETTAFLYGEGWYNDNMGFDKAEGITFEPGKGLWILADSESVKVKVAGNIKPERIELDLLNGFTAVGNCTPAVVNLQDIKLEGVGGIGNDMLQTLNVNGGTSTQYFWLNETTAFLYGEGWYNDNMGFDKAEGVAFQPGQGLWISANGNNMKIIFPSAIEKE